MTSLSAFSQTSNSRGFSELRLSYNLSFISEDPLTTSTGISFRSIYTLNDKFSIDAGMIIKPTRKEIKDHDFIGDWISTRTHTHLESTAFFMDMPIHADYRILKFKTFSLSLSSGPRFFYMNTSRDLVVTIDNQNPVYYNEDRQNLNMGLDLGFVQKLSFGDSIGLFASQHYGKALLGYSKGFESTDLDFGIILKLK